MFNWFDMSQMFNANNNEDGKENPFSFLQNMGPFANGQNMNPWSFMQSFMQNMGPCMSGQNQGAAGFGGPMQNMNPWPFMQSFMQNMGPCMNGQNQGAAGFGGPMQNMNPWPFMQSFMQNMGPCMNGQNQGAAGFGRLMQNMNPWPFMQNMGQCKNGQNDETSNENTQAMPGGGVPFNNMHQMMFMLFYMQMMFPMYCMMLMSSNAFPNWRQKENVPFGPAPFRMPFPAGQNAETKDPQSGISFGGIKLSPTDLQKLLQMNLSPKSLERLQKFLEAIFDMYSSSGT